jgi:hypothetical protein
MEVLDHTCMPYTSIASVHKIIHDYLSASEKFFGSAEAQLYFYLMVLQYQIIVISLSSLNRVLPSLQ